MEEPWGVPSQKGKGLKGWKKMRARRRKRWWWRGSGEGGGERGGRGCGPAGIVVRFRSIIDR